MAIWHYLRYPISIKSSPDQGCTIMVHKGICRVPRYYTNSCAVIWVRLGVWIGEKTFSLLAEWNLYKHLLQKIKVFLRTFFVRKTLIENAWEVMELFFRWNGTSPYFASTILPDIRRNWEFFNGFVGRL